MTAHTFLLSENFKRLQELRMVWQTPPSCYLGQSLVHDQSPAICSPPSLLKGLEEVGDTDQSL